ncbi:sarcosine oxidase subunit gamma [Paroceanicella profunda]|uniref:Sarcosine oxidase subunit gamma n=1 Tax=Paroceanicella profunda TaxID=2579971 RepID=A0A5B8G2H2_9RHOB|nr:sarcosine oxidase subunit gamma [Paroceanicella profunda]
MGRPSASGGRAPLEAGPPLAAVTALGDGAPRRAVHGVLSLEETPDLALASLALRRGAPVPAPFGLALPGPGGLAAGAGAGAFWTGPEQWMIEAPGRGTEDFAALVAAAAPGTSVTEQTDGWVAFDIASTAGAAPVEALLERLVNLPPAAVAPGRAARTGLHHMSVFVLRRAEDRLSLLGMRSAAQSLWHVLDQALARQAARP